MQLQKNLRQSIKKCHQRRLEKICSIKKKLSKLTKQHKQQSCIPTCILSEIDNPCQSRSDVKTLPIKIQQIFHRPSQIDERIQSDRSYSNLLEQTKMNKQRLQQAKQDILVLQNQLKVLQKQLLQQEIRNDHLEQDNKSLLMEVEELNKIIMEYTQKDEITKLQIEQNEQKLIELQNIIKQQRDKVKAIKDREQRQNILQKQAYDLKQLIQTKQSILTEIKKQNQTRISALKSELDETVQKLKTKNKQFEQLTTKYQQSTAQHIAHQILPQKTQSEKQKNQSYSEFSTKASNIKYQYEICILQTKINDLEQAIKNQENMKISKKVEREHKIKQINTKWQSVQPLQQNQDHNYCCSYQARLRHIQKFLQHISSSQSQLQAISSLQPSIYLSIKHLLDRNNFKQNISIFSLSPSFNKILGSYQQIAKPSQNQISNFIEEQDQVSTPEDYEQNQQQLLARMQQQVVNMSSSHGINRTDVSELKQNFNAIKMINEQLYNEVENKDKYLKELENKVKYFDNFTGMIEHIKANVETITKQLKNPSAKILAMLQNIKSMLRI